MNPFFSTEETRALSQLVDAWSDRKVVLIGAAALACQTEMTWRRTNDLDLTVISDSPATMPELHRLGFIRDVKLEHRWISSGGVVFDILPISSEDIARGELVWAESEFVMQLAAFDLLLVNTRTVTLDAVHSLEVATIPMVVLLKMAAWLDRPYDRLRDLQDIGYILSEYLPDIADRRWEDSRLEGTDFDEQSALALGLDLAQILEPQHRGLVASFLEKFDEPGSHAFYQLSSAGRSAGRDRETALSERLMAFRRGIGSP